MSPNKVVQNLLEEAIHKYKIKDFKTSKKLLENILKIEKNNYAALNNLGHINKGLGNLKEALSYYIQALKLNPNNAMNYNNLGIVYEGLKDYKRAKEAYKMAIKINPKFSKAITNMGVILYKEKKYKEAINIFNIALAVDENYHELHSNIGACFNKLKDYDKAIASLEKTIKLLPHHAGAYTNLGNVYNKTFNYKKASQLHEKSIVLNPKGFHAYSNVGTSYKYLGLSKKAITAYLKAISLHPNFVNAHFDLASMYLSQGEFEKGWEEYEWRFKKEGMFSHLLKYKDIFSKTMLKKEMNIEGKTLLLHCEQGFGDSLQFIRFLVPLKKKFKCKIAVKCRNELKELFKCLKEIDILVSRSEKTPSFDVHLPIMSLPYILEMKNTNELPKTKAYLQTKVNKKYKIKKEKGKINIGICWSASLTGESYEGKVFALKYLEDFINSKNINVYSLQVGSQKADIKKLSYEDKIIDLSAHLSDFSQTASLMKSMDLIISPDTSVAHLAGALNKPVWILLKKIPDWRWGNKGLSTPWYPSATLFRQKTARVWSDVFESMSEKLYENFNIKI
ncbi:MAG: tetratricopeptide repeat protein [Campylobacteraceae bacterium]|nr:tetratricopeptide repeat protein [Campylobacteraceae bacterium]